MEMNTCKIVQDLLPLYFDDLCSPETKQFIEEHLKECECCKTYSNEMTEGVIPKSIFENMRTELKETNEFIIEISNYVKRKIGIRLTTIVAAFLVFLLSLGILTGPELIKIPASKLTISQLKTEEEMENGFKYIRVSCRVNDRKNAYTFTNFKIFGKGDDERITTLYLTPVRPVFTKTKPDSDKNAAPGHGYMFDGTPGSAGNYIEWRLLPSDLDRICIGTESDYKVLWEKQAEQPK